MVGTVFGIYYANFPFVRRAVLDRIGGYYHPGYQAHFADPDLSLRIWAAGGRCEFSEKPLMIAEPEVGPLRDRHGQTRRLISRPQDMALFLSRWKDKYGRDWDTSYVYNFVLDLTPTMQLALARDNTVYVNSPWVKEVWENYQENVVKCTVTITFPE
jgi:hypothetical protein